jgi:3-oxoadipate enol-lactonase
MSITDFPPDPPVELPPARTVQVRGRGEFFLRDSHPNSGPQELPVVMLLHGWFASADLNWCGSYQALIDAGYRVLAIDHRGHGRGLRPLKPFTLIDCADDAAAVLRKLGVGPAIVVGYSMGGAIAQLVARDHPDVVGAVIVSGTAQHWQEPALQRSWRMLRIGGLLMRLAPNRFWTYGFKRIGFRPTPESAWLRSELLRHNPTTVIEAGHELSRFDSRPWLRKLPMPAAVVLTTRDSVVPPAKQHELARALEAPIFEAPIDHLEVTRGVGYNEPLLQALAAVRAQVAAQAA